jgi:hypothetical protein
MTARVLVVRDRTAGSLTDRFMVPVCAGNELLFPCRFRR